MVVAGAVVDFARQGKDANLDCSANRSQNKNNGEGTLGRTVTKNLTNVSKVIAQKPQPLREETQLRDHILGTTSGQWVFLVITGFILIFLGTVSWKLTGGTEAFPGDTWYDSMWMSYTLWADVGTQTGLTGNDASIVAAVAILFSVLGFVYNLALLGLVVDMIRSKLAHWKEEYGRISAKGHILLLGWGDKTLFLLDELIAADQNPELRPRGSQKRLKRRIVILADRSEYDMSQDVHSYFQSRMKKFGASSWDNIAFRQGSPMEQGDLLKVSATLAKNILVMGSSDASGSDKSTIQILLALQALKVEFSLAAEVFAEMWDQNSFTTMNEIFPDVQGIVARHAVNQMLVLRALVPSVGYTFLDLVTFKKDANRGNEVYLINVRDYPSLIDMTFVEVCRCFPDAVICGLVDEQRFRRSEGTERVEEDHHSYLMPDKNRRLKAGDKLVAMASSPSNATVFDTRNGSIMERSTVQPCFSHDLLSSGDGQIVLGESLLGAKVFMLIGCPPDFPDFLKILDGYAAPRSEVHILSTRTKEQRLDDMRNFFGDPDVTLDGRCCEEIGGSCSSSTELLKRISVQHHYGPATASWALKQLPLARADCALVLSEPGEAQDETALSADSRSLTSVMNLRRLMPKKPSDGTRKVCKVVTELLHSKSSLVVEGNDNIRFLGSFVYSSCLETGVFALAAEDKFVYSALLNILKPTRETEHIVSFPISSFVRGTEWLSFFDLHSRVYHTCEGLILGWKRSNNRYPVLNPPDKDDEYEWDQASGDELIVLCPPSQDLKGYKNSMVSDGDEQRPTLRIDAADADQMELNSLRATADSIETVKGPCSPPGCVASEGE